MTEEYFNDLIDESDFRRTYNKYQLRMYRASYYSALHKRTYLESQGLDVCSINHVIAELALRIADCLSVDASFCESDRIESERAVKILSSKSSTYFQSVSDSESNTNVSEIMPESSPSPSPSRRNDGRNDGRNDDVEDSSEAESTEGSEFLEDDLNEMNE